jgi:hypothetical protein
MLGQSLNTGILIMNSIFGERNRLVEILQLIHSYPQSKTSTLSDPEGWIFTKKPLS